MRYDYGFSLLSKRKFAAGPPVIFVHVLHKPLLDLPELLAEGDQQWGLCALDPVNHIS